MHTDCKHLPHHNAIRPSAEERNFVNVILIIIVILIVIVVSFLAKPLCIKGGVLVQLRDNYKAKVFNRAHSLVTNDAILLR